MTQRRVRVVVSGRVQGVFFRESTRRQAMLLGVTGWVRNLPDGRAEALFEGESEAVGRAVEYVRHGPELSRVDSLELDEQPFAGEYRDFRVRS